MATKGPWRVQAVGVEPHYRIVSPPPEGRDWSADHVANVFDADDAELIATVPEMAAEVAALRAERDRLREALEPFARVGASVPESFIHRDYPALNFWGTRENSLTVGDYVRARRALSGSPNQTEQP